MTDPQRRGPRTCSESRPAFQEHINVTGVRRSSHGRNSGTSSAPVPGRGPGFGSLRLRRPPMSIDAIERVPVTDWLVGLVVLACGITGIVAVWRYCEQLGGSGLAVDDGPEEGEGPGDWKPPLALPPGPGKRVIVPDPIDEELWNIIDGQDRRLPEGAKPQRVERIAARTAAPATDSAQPPSPLPHPGRGIPEHEKIAGPAVRRLFPRFELTKTPERPTGREDRGRPGPTASTHAAHSVRSAPGGWSSVAASVTPVTAAGSRRSRPRHYERRPGECSTVKRCRRWSRPGTTGVYGPPPMARGE